MRLLRPRTRARRWEADKWRGGASVQRSRGQVERRGNGRRPLVCTCTTNVRLAALLHLPSAIAAAAAAAVVKLPCGCSTSITEPGRTIARRTILAFITRRAIAAVARQRNVRGSCCPIRSPAFNINALDRTPLYFVAGGPSLCMDNALHIPLSLEYVRHCSSCS